MSKETDPIPPDEPLERLLRTWSDKHDASPEHLSALHSRITSAIRADSGPRLFGEGLPNGTGRWRRGNPYLTFFAGVAAALLVMATVFWLSSHRADAPSKVAQARPELPADYAWLREDQVRNKVRLLSDMKAVFGGQLDWIAETNDRIELGLAKDAVAPADSKALAMRIVVERRDKLTAKWTVVWAADVIALNEQPVRFRSANGTSPAALSMWAYRLPDGVIYVESDVSLLGLEPLRSRSTSLHSDRKPAEVTTVKANGAEYRVLQSATTLGDKTG